MYIFMFLLCSFSYANVILMTVVNKNLLIYTIKYLYSV